MYIIVYTQGAVQKRKFSDRLAGGRGQKLTLLSNKKPSKGFFDEPISLCSRASDYGTGDLEFSQNFIKSTFSAENGYLGVFRVADHYESGLKNF